MFLKKQIHIEMYLNKNNFGNNLSKKPRRINFKIFVKKRQKNTKKK